MKPKYLIPQTQNIQTQINHSVLQLNETQQIELLNYIEHSFITFKNSSKNLLKYAVCISKKDLNLMTNKILDCENVDANEW